MPNREIIHIALGDISCHISTHWYNLQGLAATCINSTGSSSSYCEPIVTHTTDENEVYVPRAVFVSSSNSSSNVVISNNNSSGSNDALFQQPEVITAYNNNNYNNEILTTWKGKVERMDYNTTIKENNNNNNNCYQEQQQQLFQEQAKNLAYSTYSRYRVPHQQQTTTTTTTTTYSSSGRHVNWDDDEEEDDDDEDIEERQYRERQRLIQWQNESKQIQDSLNNFWNVTTFDDDTTKTLQQQQQQSDIDVVISKHDNENDVIAQSSTTKTLKQSPHNTSWRKYLMPPYHTNMCINTPQSSNNNMFDGQQQTDTTSYYNNTATDSFNNNNNNWYENILWERIRKLLENCDSCQGIIVTIDNNNNYFTGLGTQLLQEWNNECYNTNKWTINIMNQQQQQQSNYNNQIQQRLNVLNNVQNLVTMNDQTELVDIVLPIDMSTISSSSDDYAAATIASALECITLPYRLKHHDNNINSMSKIGLNSYYMGSYGGDPYGSVSNLSLQEYTRNLQRQSTSKNILELDILQEYNKDLYSNYLIRGTSLERDQRMRQSGYDGGIHKPQNILPGEWIQNKEHNNGILTCLSPKVSNAPVKNMDRSLHHHFALSTSIRPVVSIKDNNHTTTSDYVTCLMEGMGIRYRPEQTIATTVLHSIAQLTYNGYGAGSYWRSLMTTTGGNIDGQKQQQQNFDNIPVLATLGNTTRIYSYLYDITNSVDSILSSKNKRTISRAIYNREVIAGNLPEIDDCNAALANVLDIRDSYEPPTGSGIITDEDGGEPF